LVIKLCIIPLGIRIGRDEHIIASCEEAEEVVDKVALRNGIPLKIFKEYKLTSGAGVIRRSYIKGKHYRPQLDIVVRYSVDSKRNFVVAFFSASSEILRLVGLQTDRYDINIKFEASINDTMLCFLNVVIGYNDGGKWTRPQGILASSLAASDGPHKTDGSNEWHWEDYLVHSDDIFSTDYVRILNRRQCYYNLILRALDHSKCLFHVYCRCITVSRASPLAMVDKRTTEGNWKRTNESKMEIPTSIHLAPTHEHEPRVVPTDCENSRDRNLRYDPNPPATPRRCLFSK
jgi:hypothetical protein